LDLKRRTKSFLELANRLKHFDAEMLDEVFDQAAYQNPWFTKANIRMSFDGLMNYLAEEKLLPWIAQYAFSEKESKKIGVVMAGNIPMVGIHDMICVLLSGHRLLAKLSSQDEVLIKFIAKELTDIEPDFSSRIIFAEKLKNIDAVIATGSDNTARYFEYYFSKIPHIIRKNRTSVAVLTGTESENDLISLGMDIFSYFGLGCRNVSKLLIPQGYDLKTLLPHWELYRNMADQHKYHNNYIYQRTILTINQTPHFDNGFLLITQNENLVSPIGTIYFDYYEYWEAAQDYIKSLESKIQCVVSNMNLPGAIKFGKAQMPDIHDFADNIDTMEFLTKL
jgi:hypothetical protein